jgi:Helix-hairpin-helix motif
VKQLLSIFCIVLLMLFFSAKVHAQDTIIQKGEDSEIQQQLENVAETVGSDDIDYTNLLDALDYFKQHKINLNNTTKEELEQLIFLNEIQIVNLLRHINKYGRLLTIYELQGIDGFDLQTIRKLLPYVKVADNFSTPHFGLKEMFKYGSNTVTMRYSRVIEQQKGFADIDSAALYKSPNSRYIGSPDRLYARYRFQYGNNVSWGITAEKDQGELFLKKNQRFNYDWYNASLNGNQKNGFDFYSAHFYLRNVRFVKALAIGDYQVTFGQGLTAWTSFAFSKGPNILTVKRSARGIVPYTSVNENQFLRGGATTISLKKFEFTAFYSNKPVDANVSDTTENGEVAAVSSLQETGYHSTPSEIADKHTLGQTIYGGNLSYKGKMLNWGVTAVKYELDKAYNRSLTYYSQFDFAKVENFNVGFDYNVVIRNFNFFGEAARSLNGGFAYLNGALINLDARFSLTVLQRYYSRNYQNLLSNAFADNSVASNEKGLFIGFTAKPTSSITLTGYYDRFEFPWLKYQVDAPSRGTDYIAQINYTPSKKVDMYFRVRERNYSRNNATTTFADLNYILPVNQWNYRFDISYSVLPSVRFKNRVEVVNYQREGTGIETGYLVYQDVSYSKLGVPLSLTFRYSLFQCDSYYSRIYAYENEIPGVYSIIGNYYRGSRYYILLDYNVTRNIEVWLRYSQTYYDNQTVISAGGLNEIQGRTKSEIRAQIRLKF